MTDTLTHVMEFHQAFECAISTKPTLDNSDLNELRLRLLREELTEVHEALREGDVAQVLQELSDLQYVLDGTYIALGLHVYKDIAFSEVHRANMSKLDSNGHPLKDAGGKVVKSKNFTPPDMEGVIDTVDFLRALGGRYED